MQFRGISLPVPRIHHGQGMMLLVPIRPPSSQPPPVVSVSFSGFEVDVHSCSVSKLGIKTLSPKCVGLSPHSCPFFFFFPIFSLFLPLFCYVLWTSPPLPTSGCCWGCTQP